MRISMSGLVITIIGVALTIVSAVTFELWQDNGTFYSGDMNLTALLLSAAGIVAIVYGLATLYHEHGNKLSW